MYEDMKSRSLAIELTNEEWYTILDALHLEFNRLESRWWQAKDFRERMKAEEEGKLFGNLLKKLVEHLKDAGLEYKGPWMRDVERIARGGPVFALFA